MSGTSRIWSRFFVPEGSRPSPVFPTKKWRLILAMSLEGNSPDTDAIYRFSLYPHGKADRRDSIRPKVLGGRGMGFGEGEGTFLQKGALSPPNPSPLPPKTFDWWGGRAEGVLFGGKAKRMQDIRHTLSVGQLPCRAGKVKRRREGRCFFVCRCHERESQDSLFSLQTFGAYCGTFASPSH